MSYNPTYAVQSTITTMIKYVGDDLDSELVAVAMENADATVNSRLAAYDLPQPAQIPSALTLAANYYAVSDILQSLYGDDSRSSNEQAYYEKAEQLMREYIQITLSDLAETDLKNNSPYGISQSEDAYELGLLHR